MTRQTALTAALLAGLAGAPVAAQTVTVDLTFSDKAMAMLKETGEGVILAAYWSGEPSPSATIEMDEMGRIFLLAEQVTTLPAPGRFIFGANLSSAPVDQVIAPLLNLNVYSARWADENNILHCDLVDDALAKLTAAPQKVVCRLITE
jgi:hypothetical protein